MADSSLFGLNKNVVVAASLAGAAFVGYCIYFDHKRRSAPDYKDKLRQSESSYSVFQFGEPFKHVLWILSVNFAVNYHTTETKRIGQADRCTWAVQFLAGHSKVESSLDKVV